MNVEREAPPPPFTVHRMVLDVLRALRVCSCATTVAATALYRIRLTVYRLLCACIVHRLHLEAGSDPCTLQSQLGSGGVRSRKSHSLSTTSDIGSSNNSRATEKRGETAFEATETENRKNKRETEKKRA